MDAKDLEDNIKTLGVIDREYTPIGCLGVGGFGSVYLAQKKSGRKVALKIMLMDTSDDDEFDQFMREWESVVELNQGGDEEGTTNRDLHIVFFEDWFISSNFVCIVMQYADGGTLAQEIERRSKCTTPVEPYTERRIAWYALQLCDALAFAHSRGVAHHDVKAANILIDASAGGKLLLADFGSALKPGEETVGFTKSYASPELLASHELEDYSHLRADKIDSFALGAVIYELLMCKRLEKLSTDQTLAEFITDGPGMEAALTLDHMMLPWSNGNGLVGYTYALKNLVVNFLKPNANERLLPGDLQQSLRDDPLSPLLLPHVSAAQTAKPGAPITIDNLQLGMFIQRGPDWSDDDDDGGQNSTGVVVKLDGDGNYCWGAFPSRSTGCCPETICCRIGANNKYELQVGSPVSDFVCGNGTRNDGILRVSQDEPSLSVGKMLNHNCMVVGVNSSLGVVFVAPMDRTHTPPLPKQSAWRTDNSSFASPNEQICNPSTWQTNLGSCVNVLNKEECTDVLKLFYAKSGGLKPEDCPVKSIQRIQDDWLWESYNQRRQNVAHENWGIGNEVKAFMISPGEELNATNFHNFYSNGKQFSTMASVMHNKYNKKSGKGSSQMILCRIAVGRVLDETINTPGRSHSEMIDGDLFACHGACLAYPEYIITYQDNSVPVLNTRSLSERQQTGRSESKLCVICYDRPVRYLTIPCGHPALCERCNASRIKAKLKGKCPECRQHFHTTAIIYGRVVIDE